MISKIIHTIKEVIISIYSSFRNFVVPCKFLEIEILSLNYNDKVIL